MKLFQIIQRTWNSLFRPAPLPMTEVQSVAPIAAQILLPLPSERLDPHVENLPSLPQVHPQLLRKELENNSDIVYTYLFKVLDGAIENDAEQVDLWRVDKTPMVMYLTRDQYAGCINTMIDFYLKTEQYECVPFCQDLLNQIAINELTRVS